MKGHTVLLYKHLFLDKINIKYIYGEQYTVHGATSPDLYALFTSSFFFSQVDGIFKSAAMSFFDLNPLSTA